MSISDLPNSDVARDIAHVLHPATDLVAHRRHGSKMIVQGRGIYVTDETGKEYIEGMSGLWCASLGFSEPALIEATVEAMRRLPFYHGFTGKAVKPIADLAERLTKMAPFEASKVFFSLSGSDANDSTIKLIWYYNNIIGRPQKKKIIARHRAYHGVTIAAGSLTHLPVYRGGFDQPLKDYVLHADCPHYYRYGLADESEEEFSTRMAANLENLIHSAGADTVAAFIAEPVMGAGGVIPPPMGYFEKVQAVLRAHDILFIADEVITGFCRTGSMFGCETFAITPDTMTLAKQLSGGYLPIAASLYPQRMYEAFVEESSRRGPFGHGFTYGGHPVPAAVALRTLELYEERDTLGHVRAVSPRFLARLHRLAEHSLVGEARGVGLIGALELVSEKTTRAPFDPRIGVGAYCSAAAEAHGLIGRASGDAFMLCPPLIITEPEIDEMFVRVERALDDTACWLVKNGHRAAS